MFISVRRKPMWEEVKNCFVINSDTGEKIDKVIWANDETGRYRQLLPSSNDGYVVEQYKDKRGKKAFRLRTKVFTGNIKIVKKDSIEKPS